MNEKGITRGLVHYFKSDQWRELMRQLTQTEEELYHTHVYVQNKVEANSLSKLFTRYFKRRGLQLDRRIDIIASGPNQLAAHNVHPHDPERALYTPHFDVNWRYNPDVVLEPSDPSIHGEEGTNVPTWGKSYMDNFYKKFDFKCVGPKEEREIYKYFQSAHWKKGLSFIGDPRYLHVHLNVEINFDPWILKMFAMEALKEIGWKVDHVVPCVYRIPTGYQGKMVFLTGYPQEVWDIAWGYIPDVVIRPAEKKFSGTLPDDGDIAFDVSLKRYCDELLQRDEYVSLTDEQIEEVLGQVL
jgi:hypothetical protein